MWRIGMIAAGGLVLAACESLPPLPGLGESEPAAAPAPAEVSEIAPAAVPSDAGIEGAAMCLAASEYMLEVGGIEAADEVATVWNSILDVVPGDEERKTGAARDIYAHFTNLDSLDETGQGLNAASAVYGTSCADPADQRAYLTEWGDPSLMAERIEGGS